MLYMTSFIIGTLEGAQSFIGLTGINKKSIRIINHLYGYIFISGVLSSLVMIAIIILSLAYISKIVDYSNINLTSD